MNAHRVARLAGATVLLAAVLAGCSQLDALGRIPPFPIQVSRTDDTISLAAPTWAADETLIVLCPTEPRSGRQGLQPDETLRLDEDCLSFGRFPSTQGLDADLGLGLVDATRRPTFDAAPQWWLVFVPIKGGSAAGVFQIGVDGGPIAPGVTPGPSASPTPAPSGSASPAVSSPAAASPAAPSPAASLPAPAAAAPR